jgi:hypothetical protein
MEIIRHPKYPELVGVRSVKPLAGFRVHIVFTDNTERDVDLEPYLWGPVFEPIRNDPQLFAAVHVDECGDTICWPNGADIAPETLYYEGDPPWASESKPTKATRRPRTRNAIRQRASPRRVRARA